MLIAKTTDNMEVHKNKITNSHHSQRITNILMYKLPNILHVYFL